MRASTDKEGKITMKQLHDSRPNVNVYDMRLKHNIFCETAEFINWIGMDYQIPVSYTHLDVYKRQIKFRSHTGWKQDNIWAACLGLTEEAKKLSLAKLSNGPHRFPAFWGPGYDWTPDHNWGGSGMIGLQEMLLQTNGEQILLFPAWPKEWNVHFKLHAPGETTVEATLKNGKVTDLRCV